MWGNGAAAGPAMATAAASGEGPTSPSTAPPPTPPPMATGTAAAGGGTRARASSSTQQQQSSGVWTYDASAFGDAPTASKGAIASGPSSHKGGLSVSTKPPTAPPSMHSGSNNTSNSGTTSTSGSASPSSLSLWGNGGGGSSVLGAGYIHSHVSKSRLLWNRTAPEEEEREEEALPSYLTYLQPSFSRSASGGWDEPPPTPTSMLEATGRRTPTTGASAGLASAGLSSATSVSTALLPPSISSAAPPFIPSAAASPFVPLAPAPSPVPHFATTTVETKSVELAAALQEFVRQQVEQQQQQQRLVSPGGSRHGGHGACNCEPLKLRVQDLEHKLATLQQQMSSLLAGGGSGNPGASGLTPPPPPPAPPGMMAGAMLHQPPLPPGAAPPPPPTSASAAAAAAASTSGINDRVSTLEGRQSAFQSQLAQISKVLGVPVGKHGKNSQIKNLVQTLRDEIDAKVATAAKDVATTVTQEVEALVEKRLQELPQQAAASSSSSSTTTVSTPAGPSPLSYEAVLNALAEEHEASLAKLSAYFEERLMQEGKQRVGLEGRIQSRFGEHEEWLQQLEGEFGSWHDRSSSVTSQLRVLHNKIQELEGTWHADQLKWTKLATEVQVISTTTASLASSSSTSPPKRISAAGGGASGSAAASSTSASSSSIEALTRTVHQLQVQHKQFQGDYKAEATELRENLALMETWVQTTRQETRDLGKSVKGMKQLVEKLVRDTGSAEELLQQYVSTITHQVASVTRQYVSVRIRDNNRLIDATLRARVPAYVENETESFMLVRPEKKSTTSPRILPSSGDNEPGTAGFVLKDDDEESMRKFLSQQVESRRSGGPELPSRDSSVSSTPSSSPVRLDQH